MGEEPAERQNLGLLCFYPSRAMEARLFAALGAAGFDDLTPAQGRIAARIGRSGTRLTDLAEQALVTKQTRVTWSTSWSAPATSAACPTRPTHARASCRWPSAGRRSSRWRGRSRPRSRPSGPPTSATRPPHSCALALERLREITDPYA